MSCAVCSQDAIASLLELVRSLSGLEGVHLLVYVNRAGVGRMSDNDKKSYDLFYKG
jgi:hypothetical protein